MTKHAVTILALGIGIALSSASLSAQETKNPVSMPLEDVNNNPIAATPQGTPVEQAASQQAGAPNYRGDEALRRQAQVARNPELAGRVDEYGRPIPMAEPVNRDPDFIQKIKDSFKPEQSYDLKPGNNIMVPVGKGFMNKIKTNFKSLSVKTSSSGDSTVLQVEDGNLYATVKTDSPISLLLTEDGVLESEVSVVLVPMAAPPAMIDLDIAMSQQMLAKAAEYQREIQKEEALQEAQRNAAPGSQNAPHVQNQVALLTPVAQGKLPRGFSMTNDIPPYYRQPCNIALPHETGQRLSGGREVIDVVAVHNTSERAYEVREEMCITDDVKAVGIFPRAYLMPGESTEVFIIRDKYYQREKARENNRPSLIGGAR